MSRRSPPIGSASGSQKPEADVIAEFEAAGVEVCLVALDLSTTIGTPPCSNDYVAGLRDRHRCIVQAWAAVEPAKGQAAIEEARHAIRDLKMLGFHFHPIMQHFSVDDRRFTHCLRRSRRWARR